MAAVQDNKLEFTCVSHRDSSKLLFTSVLLDELGTAVPLANITLGQNMSWSNPPNPFRPLLELEESDSGSFTPTTWGASATLLIEIFRWRQPSCVVEVGIIDRTSVFELLPSGSYRENEVQPAGEAMTDLDLCQEGSIDLLHINGESAQLMLSSNPQRWLSKLADGSVVVVSRNVRIPDPDSALWSTQLLQQFPGFRPDFDPAVTVFAPKGIEGFESVFEPIALPWMLRAFESENRLLDLRTTSDGLDAQVSHLTARCASLEAEVAAVRAEADRVRASKKALAAKLERKTQRIEKLKEGNREAPGGRGTASRAKRFFQRP